MASNSVERLNYYQRQHLGAQDFIDAQNYQRDMRRRHNLGPHVWGIVVGLELVEREVEGGGNAREVFVLPGVAVDGYGREIVVFRPIPLDPALFLRFSTTNHYSVWIGYEEESANRDNSAFNCEDDAFNRTVESFRIYVEPDDPQPNGVMVDGDEQGATNTDLRIPRDLSVPYQELPESDLDFWLIPLGEVRWDGSQFIQAVPERLTHGRQYAGLVGADLLAPATTLTLRDRYTVSPLTAGHAGVAVEVEGSLQVERDITAKEDIHVDGGMIDFRQGNEADGLFHIQRVAGPTAGGSDLQVKIGDDDDGKNRFAVVSKDEEDRLTVLDDGTTHIHGNTTIDGTSDIHGNTTIDGDVNVLNSHNVRLHGGLLQLGKPAQADPDWALRISGETLQFIQPDDNDRVTFEIFGVDDDNNAATIRLHGNPAATLSAAKLIDLTDGFDTTLHTHVSATTTTKGMVEIANSNETVATGESGARLVIGANDQRLLSVAEKTELTDGGMTTLHSHPNGMLNNVRTVRLSAIDDIPNLVTINLGSPQRVVAFIHLSSINPQEDFDSGDSLYADIFRVDGVRRPEWIAWNGDDLGAPNTDDNLMPAVYIGAAQTITFRLRSRQTTRAWAEAVVFFEHL
jgi:hypothetical protein